MKTSFVAPLYRLGPSPEKWGSGRSSCKQPLPCLQSQNTLSRDAYGLRGPRRRETRLKAALFEICRLVVGKNGRHPRGPMYCTRHGCTCPRITVFLQDKMMLDQTISAEELQQIISDGKWTKASLARTLKIGRRTLDQYLTGKKTPPPMFHMSVRWLLLEANQTYTKKKEGRPLSRTGFPLEKAICPHPDCRRPNRQMYKERAAFDHPMLGKVQPVFCTGTHAHSHPRVTRWLDRRRARLWDASNWPHRKKLAPFEIQKVKETLDVMGDAPEPELVLNCLARCVSSPDGVSGCGGFLVRSPSSSTNPATKKLYRFECPSEGCQLQWKGRLFTPSGKEVPSNPAGGSRPRESTFSIPPRARICPACGANLTSPKEVSIVGGERYSPPLLRLWCPNPKNISHRSLDRSRGGRSFYYDKKRSQFVHVYTRPRKQRGPAFSKPCRIHGRMNRTTITSIDRVPMRVRTKLGIENLEKLEHPIYRDYCPCTEVWLTEDARKTNRMRNQWKTARPFRRVRPCHVGPEILGRRVY